MTMLDDRGNTHGQFSDNALITQTNEQMFRKLPGYENATPTEREAMHMIIQKLSRAFSGDVHYDDHWFDIIGYALLVLIENQQTKEQFEQIKNRSFYDDEF